MADTPLFIKALRDRNKWHDYRDGVWGDSYGWSWERKTDDIKYLVIHHSVTAHDETPDYIAALHKARGWGGCGYHFIITKDGVVHYVGDVSTARANVANMNEKVIGMCLVGDFTKFNPSDDQILSAHDLCKFFIEQPNWPNVNSWDNLVGHKELQATACPGTYWKGVPDSMYERIKNRIPYTPIEKPPEDWKAKFDAEAMDHNGTKRSLDEMRKKVTDLSHDLEEKQKEIDNMQDYASQVLEAQQDRDQLWAYIASNIGWNKGWYDTSSEERKTVLASFGEAVTSGKQAIVELAALEKRIGEVSWHSLIIAGIRKLFERR